MGVQTGVIYGLYCKCSECSTTRPGWVRYGGQTIMPKPSRRVDQHRFESRAEGAYLAVHLWMRKHGEYNVEMRILESDVPQSDLDDRETFWIEKLKTFKDDGQGGLNLTRDGKGSEITDKSRRNQQDAMRKSRALRAEERLIQKRPGMTGPEVVSEIRDRYREDRELGFVEIARDYGFKDLKFVRDIIRNKVHIDPAYEPPKVENTPSFYRRATAGILTPTVAKRWEVACTIRGIWLQKEKTSYEVGEMFGLDHTTVWQIVNNRTYHDPTYRNTRGAFMPESVRLAVSKGLKGVKKPEGFGKKGEDSHSAKLTEEKVKDIIERLHRGEKGIDVAELYQVTPATVSRIKNNKTWTDLPRPEGFK